MLSGLSLDTAWKMIIQPQRQTYSSDNLGPGVQSFGNFNMHRCDFSVQSRSGELIPATVFVPVASGIEMGPSVPKTLNCPCVIYAHSQSGNKLEGLFLLEWCASQGYGLCVFDFLGCGKAGGLYVTLGWNEQDDLGSVVECVTRDYKATQVALWGRSMGAVTILLYLEHHSELISAVVVDSPFTDVTVMIQDVASSFVKVPKFLVSMAMSSFSGIILNKTGYNVLELRPIYSVPRCTAPITLITAKKDQLALPQRSKEMFRLYRGKDKVIIESEGEHATMRERHVIEKACNFLNAKIRMNINLEQQRGAKQPPFKPQTAFIKHLSHGDVDSYADNFISKLQTCQNSYSFRPAVSLSHPPPINFLKVTGEINMKLQPISSVPNIEMLGDERAIELDGKIDPRQRADIEKELADFQHNITIRTNTKR